MWPSGHAAAGGEVGALMPHPKHHFNWGKWPPLNSKSDWWTCRNPGDKRAETVQMWGRPANPHKRTRTRRMRKRRRAAQWRFISRKLEQHASHIVICCLLPPEPTRRKHIVGAQRRHVSDWTQRLLMYHATQSYVPNRNFSPGNYLCRNVCRISVPLQ